MSKLAAWCRKLWQATLGNEIPAESCAEWLRWLLTAFGLWLLIATRPLWLNSGAFPQVPWFGWGCAVPRSFDAVLVAVTCASLLLIGGTSANSRMNRISLISFSVTLLSLMLLDQHRCQPWAWQWLLIALILWGSPHPDAIGLWRLLTAGIYVHSAISKFDWPFCTGLGHSFLLALDHLVTQRVPGPDAWLNSPLPLLFPLGELLIGLGLCWPATRRAALVLAVLMHLLLLMILGPWGLNHSAGVLIWNLFFIGQDLLLFGPLIRRSPASSSTHSTMTNRLTEQLRPRTRPVRATTIALTAWAVIWPFFEPWGWCDVWPAWGLYGQHGERLTVRIDARDLAKLPPAWRDAAVNLPEPANDEMPTLQLRLQTVSLARTQAPLYPQNRYSLGVVLALARDVRIPPNRISVTWWKPANRWTGHQESSELPDLQAMETRASRCWFNARPR